MTQQLLTDLSECLSINLDPHKEELESILVKHRLVKPKVLTPISEIAAGICHKHGLSVEEVQCYNSYRDLLNCRYEIAHAAFNSGHSIQSIADFFNKSKNTTKYLMFKRKKALLDDY